jgi:hypothetical protein
MKPGDGVRGSASLWGSLYFAEYLQVDCRGTQCLEGGGTQCLSENWVTRTRPKLLWFSISFPDNLDWVYIQLSDKPETRK